MAEVRVKYLPQEEIELAALATLDAYERRFGEVSEPPVPIEEILECLLKFDFGFEDLRGAGFGPDVLGAMWVPERRVRVDSSLDPTRFSEKEGRYRFTVGHEIGHWQLHRHLFLADVNQPMLFGASPEPSVICRSGPRKEPVEWQADAFAARLLIVNREERRMIEAKIETEVVLRDFVYLDWERVRSLCAQLFAGVPQDSTKEKGHNVGTKGQLEGGIPAVLKGHGEADYRYFRTENETRSLHHYVYSLFEERLVDRGMVTEVEDDFDITQWNEDFFHDGRFIRVVGLVRLMDYAWVSTMMEALPEMMRAAQHAENISLKERLAAQEISKREYEAQQKEQQKQLHELKSLKLDKMTGLVRQLYGDVVRVKVVPDKYRPSNVFVGSGDLAHFHDSAASLSQKYGYEIDADWVTLGQVNRSTASAEPMSIPVGNEMEDSFEAVALEVNGITRVASATTFPAVSFTPISIYRKC